MKIIKVIVFLLLFLFGFLSLAFFFGDSKNTILVMVLGLFISLLINVWAGFLFGRWWIAGFSAWGTTIVGIIFLVYYWYYGQRELAWQSLSMQVPLLLAFTFGLAGVKIRETKIVGSG